MKIGVRAHDYGKHSIEGLASLLREEGYDGAGWRFPRYLRRLTAMRISGCPTLSESEGHLRRTGWRFR